MLILTEDIYVDALEQMKINMQLITYIILKLENMCSCVFTHWVGEAESLNCNWIRVELQGNLLAEDVLLPPCKILELVTLPTYKCCLDERLNLS